jgi:hypothetical protein
MTVQTRTKKVKIKSPLDGASYLVNKAQYVFPVVRNAKNPHITDWENAASNDPGQIRRWAKEFPGCNWGWALGRTHRSAIDTDVKNGKPGKESHQMLQDEHGFPQTWKQTTPSEGWHEVYDGLSSCSSDRLAPGIDTKSKGGYILAPGSVIDGKSYTIVDDVPFTPIPAWISEKLSAARKARHQETLDDIDGLDDWDFEIDALPVDDWVKEILRDPETEVGKRSEQEMSILCALVPILSNDQIRRFWEIEEQGIGQRWSERGHNDNWMDQQIQRARQHVAKRPKVGFEGFDAADQMETIDDLVRLFNRDHAVLMVGSKCLVLSEVTDPTFGRPDVLFSALSDFKAFHKPKKIFKENANTGKVKMIPATDIWLDSPERRQYQGIVFDPKGDAPGYYNLWRGFSVKPTPGEWSLMRDHIRTIICSGREELAGYLFAWMADMFQRPHKRPGIAPVLRGGQGIGKGTFVTELGEALGPHFLHITSGSHLTGRFNGHFKNCLLCFADEACWAGDRSGAGVLKGLITETTLTVEQKGKDAFAVRNNVRLIVASNGSWVVPADLDDRRFLFLDVSPERKNDHAYFAAIRKQMEDGGREAMLHDLLAMDISGVNLRAVPKTAGLGDQKLRSADLTTKFWFECLCAGRQLGYAESWLTTVPTERLHQEYCEFCKKLNTRFIDTASVFARRLRQLCPGIEGPKRLSVNAVNPDGTETKTRLYALVFPTLEEARASFEDAASCSFTWEG